MTNERLEELIAFYATCSGPMSIGVEKALRELLSLRETVEKQRKALYEIERFGHDYGHGRGYTCANTAANALGMQWHGELCPKAE